MRCLRYACLHSGSWPLSGFLFWFGCLIQIRGIEKLSFGLCDQGFFSLGAKLAGCEDV